MSMTPVAWSLDVNGAAALGAWPGCVNSACRPGEVVLSDMGR